MKGREVMLVGDPSLNDQNIVNSNEENYSQRRGRDFDRMQLSDKWRNKLTQ